MKVSEARVLRKSGLVISATIYPYDGMEDRWLLELQVNSSVDFPTRKIHTERGDLRIFKSVDAAVSAVKLIGLSEVTVRF